MLNIHWAFMPTYWRVYEWILSYGAYCRFNYHIAIDVITSQNYIVLHHNLCWLMCLCPECYHPWGLNSLTLRLCKPSVKLISMWIYQKWISASSLLKPQLFALIYNLCPMRCLHWLMVLLPSAIIKCCLQQLFSVAITSVLSNFESV